MKDDGGQQAGQFEVGKQSRQRINLALQGGGAHGAFTWGVLDELLQDEALSLGWVSGTSAGAVNAAALASGLAGGGPAGARAALRRVWEAVGPSGWECKADGSTSWP